MSEDLLIRHCSPTLAIPKMDFCLITESPLLSEMRSLLLFSAVLLCRKYFGNLYRFHIKNLLDDFFLLIVITLQ